MNRALLQRLAEDRVLDAKTLLRGKRWPYAYYVAGYAVECALKSCILSRVVLTGNIFLDKKFAEKCWVHDLKELIELAGLDDELKAQLKASPAFRGFWGTATQWNESSRYMVKGEADAKALFKAITQKTHGVLPWLKKFW